MLTSTQMARLLALPADARCGLYQYQYKRWQEEEPWSRGRGKAAVLLNELEQLWGLDAACIARWRREVPPHSGAATNGIEASSGER